MTDLSPDIEAELAALADGSLEPERRERVLERVRASPELGAALAEQHQAVAVTAAVGVRAPEALRGQVEAMLAPHGGRPARLPAASRRPRLGVAAAALTTAAV